MKINALALQTGLTASAIRFYEQEGLLDARHVRRGENNYRDYHEEAVDRLRMIKKIQAAGFSIAELKAMIHASEVDELPLTKIIDHLRQKIEEITRKKAELDQVQELLQKMLEHKMALWEASEKQNREEDSCKD